MDNIRYETYLTENTHVHLSNGNKKLGKGIWNISLLPGDGLLTKKDGEILTNIPGTCDGCDETCKDVCYAIDYVKAKCNTCVPAYADNTVLARNELEIYFREIQNAIDRCFIRAFRWHVSGEIPSKDYLYGMIGIAERNPDVIFYTYSKRYEWIDEYIDKNGVLPSNLTILVSPFNNDYSNPHSFPTFEYDDGSNPELRNLHHCPAVNRNGHETGITCSQCRRCITAAHGMRTAVYAH